jgi:hypothetical protein
MAEPVEFFDKKLPYDLSSHGGLAALIGRLLRRINFPAMVDTDDVFLFGFAEDLFCIGAVADPTRMHLRG